jgi:hypothetical protein
MRIFKTCALAVTIGLGGCIFGTSHGSDGGCPVIIGWGNYYYIGTQILSSNGGADFLSDSSALFDGKPSTPARISWTSNPQDADSYVSVKINITPESDGDTPIPVPVGVIVVKNTSLPAGMRVELYQDTIDLVAGADLENDPAGGTSICFVFDNRDAAVFEIRFVRGSTGMDGSDTFTIGEIFAGARADMPLKRTPRIASANTNKQNLSAADTTFGVWSPRVRQNHYEFAPIAQKEALCADDGEVDFETLITSIMNSDVAAFIPFVTLDPAAYPANTHSPELSQSSYRIRARTAYLGQFIQSPTNTGGGDKFYNTTMDVQESI